MDAFLAASKARVLPVDADALEFTLDSYFDSEPPFGSGRNKAQFPDALVIGTLKKEASLLEPMCVVTGDINFRAACGPRDGFYTFEKLSMFLDEVTSEDKRAVFVRDVIGNFDADVIEAIRKECANLTVGVRGVNAYVHERTLLDLAFADSEIEIIALEPDHRSRSPTTHDHVSARTRNAS